MIEYANYETNYGYPVFCLSPNYLKYKAKMVFDLNPEFYRYLKMIQPCMYLFI